MNWFILLAAPQGETCVAAGCIGRGFRSLAPQIRKRVRHGRGKLIERAYAMFPGYVFVQCRSTDFARVRSVPKVVNFLRRRHDDFIRDFEPTVVPESAIQAVIAKEAEIERRRMANLKSRVKHDFRAGDVIEIEDGPLSGLLTNIEAIDARGRIAILHNMLGRAVRIELDASQIRAA